MFYTEEQIQKPCRRSMPSRISKWQESQSGWSGVSKREGQRDDRKPGHRGTVTLTLSEKKNKNRRET